MCTPAGLIPVGVCGLTRGEHFAALLARDAIAERVTTEDLAAARSWRHVPRARWVGSLQVLHAVDELFTSLGFTWGPTGSVGFELATGVAAAAPPATSTWSSGRRRPGADQRCRRGQRFGRVGRTGVWQPIVNPQPGRPRAGGRASSSRASSATRRVVRLGAAAAAAPPGAGSCVGATRRAAPPPSAPARANLRLSGRSRRSRRP